MAGFPAILFLATDILYKQRFVVDRQHISTAWTGSTLGLLANICPRPAQCNTQNDNVKFNKKSNVEDFPITLSLLH